MHTADDLKFRQFNIKDRTIIQSFINDFQPMSCEYNFANLFVWQYVSKLSWTIYKGRLLIYDAVDYKCSFMPLGRDFSPIELANLSQNLKKRGLSPDFCLVRSKYIDKFLEIKHYYNIKKQRDYAEYIYDAKKLGKLTGTKLHKKRNLIAQFKRSFPDFKVDTFKKEYNSKIIDFSQNLMNRLDKQSKTVVQEFNALQKTLEYFDELELEGLIICIKDKVIAFSIFSKLNSFTYDIQFEKADNNFKGASQVINHETAKYLENRCKYLNREQDLGINGLRQSKMSYEPLKLMMPHVIEFKDFPHT
jgi:uncharacterized protein